MDRPRFGIEAFAKNPWEGPWMNRQQLLSRLAERGYPTLYSNGLWKVWDRDRPGWRSAPWAGDWCLRDGVWVDRPPRWLLRWPYCEVWDRGVLRVGGRRIRRQMTRMGGRPTVGYLFHPDFLPLADRMRPDFLVYHAFDLLWEQANSRQKNLLRETLNRADLVVASSTPIATEQEGVSGRRDIRVLPNGVDFPAFAQGQDCPIPADFDRIPHPRILYAGNLNRKVDLPMIADLAWHRPEWHFVFVGGQGNLDAVTGRGWEACRNRENVHFLGEKPRAQLPAYMAHADVNIMAYRHGHGLWTDGGYPLKLHEYLAAGRPVVSTPLATVTPFAHVLALAEGSREWEGELHRALEEGGVGDPRERRAVAGRNSWETRVDALEGWLWELAGAHHLDRRGEAATPAVGTAGTATEPTAPSPGRKP